MKTTLKNIAIALGLTAALGSAALFAENQSIAKIPFDFQITGATLPAGQYVVSLASNTQTIVFRNVATGHSSVMMAHPFQSGTTEEPKLVFRGNGEHYKLESAWFAGVQGGYGPLRRNKDRTDGERGVAATVRLLQK